MTVKDPLRHLPPNLDPSRPLDMPLFSHLRSPVPAVASSSTYLSFPAPPLSLSPARTFSAAPSPRAAAVVVAPPPTAPTASASHAVVPELASIPSTVGSLRVRLCFPLLELALRLIPTQKPRRPASTFTGGLIGLLLGVSLASLYASARLLNDYQKASSLLLASVQELEDATLQVRRALVSLSPSTLALALRPPVGRSCQHRHACQLIPIGRADVESRPTGRGGRGQAGACKGRWSAEGGPQEAASRLEKVLRECPSSSCLGRRRRSRWRSSLVFSPPRPRPTSSGSTSARGAGSQVSCLGFGSVWEVRYLQHMMRLSRPFVHLSRRGPSRESIRVRIISIRFRSAANSSFV